MKIFLTGGTGFIGSTFLEHVIALGNKVVALKRDVHSTPKITIQSDPAWLIKTYRQLVADDFSDCNILVHLAAHSANVPYDTLQNCLEHNLLGPLHMLELARESGIKNYLVIGTCFEYGISAQKYDLIPADAPLQPTQTYPASKAAASTVIQQWSIEHRLNTSIARLFQVYGDGEMPTRLWPSLITAARDGSDFPLSPGQQIRDFISVEEVAHILYEECMSLTNNPVPRFTQFNVGSGSPTSILEFAMSVWRRQNATGKLLPGKLDYRQGEMMRYLPCLLRKTYEYE